MRHGSLFSGIGGFDLAAEWMGWENVFHCEWNEFCKRVLKHYWPQSISYHDITKTDFTIHRGTIDILTGGFPCQPYSMAGKRKGKEDERHLWPEMCRVIREINPRWIIGENVFGLVNWSGGLVFHEVQSDLEAEGYEVFPYVLPAAAVNAPHRRDRVWFVAYCNNNGLNQCNGTHEINTSEGRFDAFSNINESNGNGDATDTKCVRLEHTEETGNIRKSETKTQRQRSKSSESIETNGINEYATNTGSERCEWSSKFRETNNKEWEDSKLWETTSKHSPGFWWQTFPTVSPICNGNDGISDRLDGITFPKWRKESIKAGGNAIVPQVAYQLFKTIKQYENLH